MPSNRVTLSPFRQSLRRLVTPVLGLLYPRNCLFCQSFPESGIEFLADVFPVCETCQRLIWPSAEPCCEICGESFPTEGDGPFTCQTCLGRRFEFSSAVAAYQSRGVIRTAIHRFKYRREFHLRSVLGTLLSDVFDHPRMPDLHHPILVPVPLHPKRQREREFNQAIELCRVLHTRHRLPWHPALERTRITESQTMFRKDERMKNLLNAFRVHPRSREKLRGRDVLLVDDVLTTGSTAHECASALHRESDAGKVVVITIARG